MRRGEVRWYTFRTPDKRRPAVIITRNAALSFLTSVTVAPITSTIRNIPTEVVLTPHEDGIYSLCAVNLDNILTVQKAQLGALITVLSPARLQEIDHAICFALGVNPA